MRACSLLSGVLILVTFGQVKVLSPDALRDVFGVNGSKTAPQGIIPVSTATFGAPLYGESMVGQLSLVSNQGCAPSDYSPSATPTASLKNFLVIRRGGCAFSEKVLLAQDVGHAQAVMIVDEKNSTWTRSEIENAVLADTSNKGSSIHIPSVLISNDDGEEIIKSVQKGSVIISFEWSFPQREIVRVDYWYSPDHEESVKALAVAAPILQSLKGQIDLHPHLYLITSDTPTAATCFDSNPQLCLASNSTDVLAVASQQLCLHKVTSAPHKISAASSDGIVEDDEDDDVTVQFSTPYWEYMRMFAERCMKNEQLKKCSDEILKTLKVSTDDIATCEKNDVVGLAQFDRENSAWGVTAARINGAKYAGSTLDPVQLLRSACTALEAHSDVCLQQIKKVQDDSTADASSKKNDTPHESPEEEGIIGVGELMLLSVSTFGAAAIVMWLYNNWLRLKIKREKRREFRQQFEHYYRVDEPWNRTNELEFMHQQSASKSIMQGYDHI